MVSATHWWYAPKTSRRSSGSSREASAVEPTRSQNITVIWRRSALSVRRGADAEAGAEASDRSTAIAASNLRRCPTRLTPRSFRSSAVSSGNTAASIALSRNVSSYCCNPRPRSHTAMSTLASRGVPKALTYPTQNWGCARTLRTACRAYSIRGPTYLLTRCEVPCHMSRQGQHSPSFSAWSKEVRSGALRLTQGDVWLGPNGNNWVDCRPSPIPWRTARLRRLRPFAGPRPSGKGQRLLSDRLAALCAVAPGSSHTGFPPAVLENLPL